MGYKSHRKTDAQTNLEMVNNKKKKKTNKKGGVRE
jgi:hypothetical protein